MNTSENEKVEVIMGEPLENKEFYKWVEEMNKDTTLGYTIDSINNNPPPNFTKKDKINWSELQIVGCICTRHPVQGERITIRNIDTLQIIYWAHDQFDYGKYAMIEAWSENSIKVVDIILRYIPNKGIQLYTDEYKRTLDFSKIMVNIKNIGIHTL